MNRLKELRKKNEMTQVEVAFLLGISQNNYSYWENGKVRIDSNSLKKLADYYEVSVDYILNFKDDTVLNENEKELLKYYKLCNPLEQGKIIGYAKGLTKKDEE